MPKKPVIDADHVLRWVPKTKLTHDPDTMEIRGLQPIAFKLNEKEEYLSAAWLEYYGGTDDEQIKAASQKLGSIIQARKTGAFALGNVGKIRTDSLAQSGVTVSVFNDGTPAHPAYAKVYGVPRDDDALQALLALKSWSKLIKAIDVLP